MLAGSRPVLLTNRDTAQMNFWRRSLQVTSESGLPAPGVKGSGCRSIPM